MYCGPVVFLLTETQVYYRNNFYDRFANIAWQWLKWAEPLKQQNENWKAEPLF